MALSTMLLQVQRVSSKGMFGVLAFECSCAQAFQFPSDNGKEDERRNEASLAKFLTGKLMPSGIDPPWAFHQYVYRMYT
ncbi:hypothetical protein AN416_02210 [Paraburkholderia caribensis]|nr:hypothetical protein AN416_02210 [Paraburkholderia caribensis]AUT53254.1 hypothetical protein C2L66_16260 [Paraburkholderia caribensis]